MRSGETPFPRRDLFRQVSSILCTLHTLFIQQADASDTYFIFFVFTVYNYG